MFILCGLILEAGENLFQDFWSPFSIPFVFFSVTIKKTQPAYGPCPTRTLGPSRLYKPGSPARGLQTLPPRPPPPPCTASHPPCAAAGPVAGVAGVVFFYSPVFFPKNRLVFPTVLFAFFSFGFFRFIF